MNSALNSGDFNKAKRLGEQAMRKSSGISFSFQEEYELYCTLGNIYYRLMKYSKSLDVYYKAAMLVLRHPLNPDQNAFPAVRLANNFMLLRNIKSALRQYHKAEEYFEKYGTDSRIMNKELYFSVIMGLVYCYIYGNQLPKAHELMNGKLLKYEAEIANSNILSINYHHLKGEYEIAVKNNNSARNSFIECVRLSGLLGAPEAALAARIHIAIIDLLEKRYESAENVLKTVINGAGRIRLNEIEGEASLILSKCYTLMNMPGRALAVEKRIKPFLNRIDMGWLYEMNREYERLFSKPQQDKKNDAQPTPKALTNTILDRCRRFGSNEEIIGASLTMRDIYNLIEKVAATDLPVLIQGETGTGKELITGALHRKSLRKDKTLLSLNCGVISETLLESELFGYVKGAFTGAEGNKKGYMEIASEGTLFLDEIADMSLKMQQHLLRAIEEKQIWKIGSELPSAINTRLIFASNRDIEHLISKKLFREDLFYRINTIIINLPPLRERKEDIPLLAVHFINMFSAGKNAPKLTEKAMAVLLNYSWPGNIRELKNEIKRICVLYNDIAIIDETMLSKAISTAPATDCRGSAGSKGLKEIMAESESALIIKTIRECNGNISKAAQVLKCSRSQFYYKMRALKIPTGNR